MWGNLIRTPTAIVIKGWGKHGEQMQIGSTDSVLDHLGHFSSVLQETTCFCVVKITPQ